jgi:hypothetical protein
LVRAAAAGVDLGSVVAGLNAPPPNQRFRVLLARALRMAEELRSFGAATLRVLERKDAEGLAALRANNEFELVEAMRDIQKVKIRQVESRQAALAQQSIAIIAEIARLQALIDNPITPQQIVAQQSRTEAKVIGTVVEGINLAAKVARVIPEFQVGAAGGFSSPFTTAQIGGHMAADIALAAAQSGLALARVYTDQAALAEAQAAIEAAKREWQAQQIQLATEQQQLEKQINQIDLELEIQNAELKRDEAAVENAKAVEKYLQDKYTNAELYGWMLGEVSSLYFQAYKFAFDTAKLAERAYQYEQGDSAVQFVQFSYWDSFKKGLYAGERLLVDLRRMENAYAEADRRALEVTRHVSLRADYPVEFQQLLGSGRCELEVSEALLDGDFPGHYFRRIKTVSLSVIGQLRAFTNVNCTLTLLRNRVRTNPNASGMYVQAEDGDDQRFVMDIAPVQAIATSRPNTDAGLFELRFDDERYLPFEGAGAISSWRIDLRQTDNALNLEQLRDVVMSISYTARSAGEPLEAAARASREKALQRGTMSPPLRHLVSLAQDLPNAWKRVLESKTGSDVELDLPMSSNELSARLRGFNVRIERVAAYVHVQRSKVDGLRLKLAPPKGSGNTLSEWSRPWPNGSILRAEGDIGGNPGMWKLTISGVGTNPAELFDDIVLVFDLRTNRGEGG